MYVALSIQHAEKINTEVPTLFSLNQKLNSDSLLSCADKASMDAHTADIELSPRQISRSSLFSSVIHPIFVESRIGESEITLVDPQVDSFSLDDQTNSIAELEEMSAAEKARKGLLGLDFKIIKVPNPQTQRLCTKYVCTHRINGVECGKQSENKWSFLDHNRHHTGLRPYVCSYCSKSFTQRGNLRQHRLIHSRS